MRLCPDGQWEGGISLSFVLCSEEGVRSFLDLAQSLKENKVDLSFSLTLFYYQ